MNPNATRVLIVDDNISASRLQDALQAHGCDVRTAADARTAIILSQVWHPHIVLLELVLPDSSDGLTMLRRLKAHRPAVPIVIVTSHATVPRTVEALTSGALTLLEKPVDHGALLAAVDRAGPQPFQHGDAGTPDGGGTVHRLGGLVTCDPTMAHQFELLRTAAPTMVNVLLLGENGTGKELAASALHELSPRRSRPFVRLNCAAIPGELLEAELFGYRRGAFTGAATDKPGLFEVAGNGSLLLDEIGEMSPHLQAKLLRVLQEREFRPVGGARAIKAEFRLICATNVDPQAQVRNGRLRTDLYFRLNTICIQLVPLRDRPADISLLAARFLEQFAHQHGRDRRGFEPEALDCLQRHKWPGNVRELEHVMERAVILGRKPYVSVDDLPESVRRPGRAALGLHPLPGGCTLEELERLAILQTLEVTGWNKRATAHLLGIHRPTLYNKLRKYRLWRRQDRFSHGYDRDEQDVEAAG